jgi:PKD repeat protein
VRNTRTYHVVGRIAVLIACGITAVASAQTRTIRIVTYNIMADIDGFTTPLAGLITPFSGTGTFTENSSGTVTNGGVLEGIGEEILAGNFQPIDILALQEPTNNAVTVQPIVNGLNAFYSSRGIQAGYAMSPLQLTSTGGGGGGPNALVYNTNTVQLVASVGVGTPSGTNISRQVGRYLFAPAGVATNASNIFYVYVSHYKSGTTSTDLARRGIEAGVIRTNSATLPANSRVLYVGDYNVSSSTETSYQAIVGNTIVPIGIRGIDPFNTNGATGVDWTLNSLLSNKTFSCRSLQFRDDFQIMSSNVYYGVAGGLAYISGTYHTFGNNGSIPYTGSTINNANTALNGNLQSNPPISAAQCRTNLYGATDHLPVVADYTIPLGASAPSAIFSGSPTNGTAPLLVTFTDTSTGSITNRFWDFGGGATTNVTTNGVSHTYSAGTYSVKLIVTGLGGASTNTQSNYITVTPPPPVALFTGSPTNGTVPLMVNFADNSTGTITSNFWSFGDGGTTNFTAATNVAYTYSTAGVYTVTLIVTGSGGAGTNQQAKLVTVLDRFSAWQLQYFGCTNCPQALAGADPFGKGMSNTNQFLAGLNPTNPASLFVITSIVADSNNNVLITWSTAGVRTNVVQATSGDVNGSGNYSNNFQDLTNATFIINVNDDTSTNDTDVGGATNAPARYYRIRLVP